jgi:putative MATE family efflux protein
MGSANKAVLVEGSVGKTLIRLTIPMIFGMIGIVAFNLVDTFFVGRLGTNELAALSFTFPVVIVINSLALGLGTGASAVISRAIGEGDHYRVKRLTTDSLILSVLVVMCFVVLGLLTIDPVFRMLGATSRTLPLIRQYMRIWYLGVGFVVIPMVGNNAIRATGDTKTPSIIMLIAVAVNTTLDPLLIFGLGPFPRLEIAGAALATVFARATTFTVAVWVLGYRDKMLTRVIPTLRTVVDSWKCILFIGIPTAATRIILPIAMGVVTRLVASYGAEAVAGFGVATRIEFFALTVVRALSSVLMPFIGQNWGAGKHDRVTSGVSVSNKISLLWGALMFAVLAVAAAPIARIFNSDPSVVSTTTLYLRIVPTGYGVYGVIILAAAVLNVLHKPLHAAGLTIAHTHVRALHPACTGRLILLRPPRHVHRPGSFLLPRRPGHSSPDEKNPRGKVWGLSVSPLLRGVPIVLVLGTPPSAVVTGPPSGSPCLFLIPVVVLFGLDCSVIQ